MHRNMKSKTVGVGQREREGSQSRTGSEGNESDMAGWKKATREAGKVGREVAGKRGEG